MCFSKSNFDGKIWTKTLPKPLQFSSCAVYNGVCYIFGGRGSPNEPSDMLIKVTDDNVFVIEMSTYMKPSPRWSHTLTLCNEKLYVVGGRNMFSVFKGIHQFDFHNWTMKLKLKQVNQCNCCVTKLLYWCTLESGVPCLGKRSLFSPP